MLREEVVRGGVEPPTFRFSVLLPEDQEFGILGHLTPGQHHQTAGHAAHEQVDDGEDHSAMISTPEIKVL